MKNNPLLRKLKKSLKEFKKTHPDSEVIYVTMDQPFFFDLAYTLDVDFDELDDILGMTVRVAREGLVIEEPGYIISSVDLTNVNEMWELLNIMKNRIHELEDELSHVWKDLNAGKYN